MSADGIWATKTYAVGPRSRFTVDVEIEFGQFHVPEDPSFGRFLPHPFGALVESLGPVPIVLERALYSSGFDGIKWSAGAASLATKVRD